ncbi:xanthine dehydrogenase family protein molybdopterin-binding subunit [Actinomycetospora corticicola]|uniref:Xanthine dehydrogenase YagR molybdenum-binding subunit n=1 Tax=Actinomycetospora corticicola TaxID=663602 RepID=A0A7Y9J7L1_9PSEU|nr:xanthine dehydrogenase family protein molybdopterin-binding subunit [Actinomycetospora corticicola]NYD37524.1 xanthine dehydrogenase YagR molybdenum-binding subunit [Actinomycetospora corticicola]
MSITAQSMGTSHPRIEGPQKVAGTARYAFEYPVVRPLYLHPVQSTIARGRITAIDASAAEALDGVVAVITHENAVRLADTSDAEWSVLQTPEVGFRGQYVAGVLAEGSEIARQAAELVAVAYDQDTHVASLDEHSPDLYAPDVVNPAFATDESVGDPDAALAAAEYTVRQTYTTAMTHNNPLEPHTTIATWDAEGGRLTLFESTQGVVTTRKAVMSLFGLDADAVTVIAPHVGGGFGSKGNLHANTVLATLAAMAVPGRAVKYALTRQQMFDLVGYRTPTIQHVALGAEADGTLTAITHDVVEQTARYKEFAEQTATYSRSMYATPNRRTTHRLVPLDVGMASWMRAPGEAPGSFAAEVAMDELAVVAGLDPVELRVRNEPTVSPESGLPFSSRNLVACLRRGAERFAWSHRDPQPRARLVDGWWHGTGVAGSSYPVNTMPGSTAVIRFHHDPSLDPALGATGRYEVEIAAADIGTGARTVLTQIAADALGVPAEVVDVEIGDTALPTASLAGGSSGTGSWGATIADTADRFRDKWGSDPEDGAEADGAMPDNAYGDQYAMSAYGAHFVEIAVHADTGEIRVPRMLGVFAAGRIVNPTLGRSQFLGGMTMGLSMALHEQSVLDPRTGHVVNRDLANYHVVSNADVNSMEIDWIDEQDPYVNPMGTKGIGEIGIVGSAAAIANAAYHATGRRVRSLPLTVDDFIG